LLDSLLDSGIPRVTVAEPRGQARLSRYVYEWMPPSRGVSAAMEFHQGMPCLTFSSRRDLREPATCHQTSAATWPVFRGGGFAAGACFLFHFPFSRLLPECRAWLVLWAIVAGWTRLFLPDDLRDLGIVGLCCALCSRGQCQKGPPSKGAEGQSIVVCMITRCDISMPFCAPGLFTTCSSSTAATAGEYGDRWRRTSQTRYHQARSRKKEVAGSPFRHP